MKHEHVARKPAGAAEAALPAAPRWLQAATPKRLLIASLVLAFFTIALKTLAWKLTGSVGLLSDAVESLVNLAGAAFALAMVTIAARPADADHPYGHFKAEYFSSGFEGLLIFLAAGAILWVAVQRLFDPQPLQAVGWGLALSVASSILNGVLAWLMLRAARVHRSIALEADGRHLLADVWTSAGVVIGIGLVLLTDWLWLDPVVAICVALNILYEGGQLVWQSTQGLMDEAVEPEVQQQIEQTLARFTDPAMRFDHLTTRRSGQRRFVDLHLHLPAKWTLGRAATARAGVEQALIAAVPGLRATIQLLPSNVEVEAHASDPEEPT